MLCLYCSVSITTGLVLNTTGISSELRGTGSAQLDDLRTKESETEVCLSDE